MTYNKLIRLKLFKKRASVKSLCQLPHETWQIHSCTFGILDHIYKKWIQFYKFGHDPCWRLHITYQQFIMAVTTDSSSPKKHQTNKSHVTSCFNKDIHVFSKMVRRTSEAAGTLFAAARGGIRSFVALNEVWGVWEEEIDNNQHHRLAAFSLHTIQDACSLKRDDAETMFDGEETSVSCLQLNTEIKTTNSNTRPTFKPCLSNISRELSEAKDTTRYVKMWRASEAFKCVLTFN